MNNISLAKSVLAGAVLLAALRSVAQATNSTAPATTQAPTATKATPQTAAKATLTSRCSQRHWFGCAHGALCS